MLTGITMLPVSYSQLKAKPECETFTVDILNGTVNGVKPDFNKEQIKEKLPCFTGEEQEPNAKCGNVILYKDRDLTFFVKRQYVEIGPQFKGKLSIPLMNAGRSDLFKWLGNPKIKDSKWDAYVMNYGTLVLHYNASGKVNLIHFSTKSTDELNLCE